MGRVRKSKRNLSLRNKKIIAKRWEEKKERVNDAEPGTSRVMSQSALDYNAVFSIANDSLSESSNSLLQDNKQTGFALYNSYNTIIPVNNNDAPEYMLLDKIHFIQLLSLFPCPACLSKTVVVNEAVVKGYANIFQISCSTCDHKIKFETSGRISKHDSSRPPYDVNRRIVHAFICMGKGHKGLDVFSLFLNMPLMNNEAYNLHCRNISRITVKNVETSLQQARTEVRKAYTVLDDTDNSKLIELTVSYDGSWQKRGFTSKYGIGCCIEVVTGLVVGFEILSKFCAICERKKTMLGESSIKYKEWFEIHKNNCQCNYKGSSPFYGDDSGRKNLVEVRTFWLSIHHIGFRW